MKSFPHSLLVLLAAVIATPLSAQFPLLNFIHLGKDSVKVLVEAKGMTYYDYDDYYEEETWSDDNEEMEVEVVPADSIGMGMGNQDVEAIEEVVEINEMEVSVVQEDTFLYVSVPLETSLAIYPSEEYGYSGNYANINFRNDSCYWIQYNFFNDPFVIENIRKVIEMRSDFTPCEDLSDCWIQQKPGDPNKYYWNLFDTYEYDENWGVLIIETPENYFLSLSYYQSSKY